MFFAAIILGELYFFHIQSPPFFSFLWFLETFVLGAEAGDEMSFAWSH
jgi:hypothetical protein